LVNVDDGELRVREVRGHSVDRRRLRETDTDRQVIALARERREVRDVLLCRLGLVDPLLEPQLRLAALEPNIREVVEATVVEPADVGDEADLDLAAASRRSGGRGGLLAAATAGSNEKHEGAEKCKRSFHP